MMDIPALNSMLKRLPSGSEYPYTIPGPTASPKCLLSDHSASYLMPCTPSATKLLTIGLPLIQYLSCTSAPLVLQSIGFASRL